jgi:isochorismate hydrolase
MNAFEDEAFRQAVQATGRRRLIIGGLYTEICRTFATIQALKDGYDVLYVADAVGGRSQTAHRIGVERLAHASSSRVGHCWDARGWLQPRPRGRPASHRPSPRPSGYAPGP